MWVCSILHNFCSSCPCLPAGWTGTARLHFRKLAMRCQGLLRHDGLSREHAPLVLVPRLVICCLPRHPLPCLPAAAAEMRRRRGFEHPRARHRASCCSLCRSQQHCAPAAGCVSPKQTEQPCCACRLPAATVLSAACCPPAACCLPPVAHLLLHIAMLASLCGRAVSSGGGIITGIGCTYRCDCHLPCLCFNRPLQRRKHNNTVPRSDSC
jgi:hypothetical protein